MPNEAGDLQREMVFSQTKGNSIMFSQEAPALNRPGKIRYGNRKPGGERERKLFGALCAIAAGRWVGRCSLTQRLFLTKEPRFRSFESFILLEKVRIPREPCTPRE